MQVNILEAKNRLSQLIKYAQAGDEVVIANRGAPVARLVAAKAFDAAGATNPNFLHWLEKNPLPLHAQRSAQEIDAGINEERAAWD
ncbi:MAG: type II toxin-antitoxin system prevent-host-death family antitoxin [Polaromonas sp.]|nr:type II toxin-antitoxin system prevent-host-death family antitoxin [Polaromonas sp.]